MIQLTGDASTKNMKIFLNSGSHLSSSKCNFQERTVVEGETNGD